MNLCKKIFWNKRNQALTKDWDLLEKCFVWSDLLLEHLYFLLATLLKQNQSTINTSNSSFQYHAWNSNYSSQFDLLQNFYIQTYAWVIIAALNIISFPRTNTAGPWGRGIGAASGRISWNNIYYIFVLSKCLLHVNNGLHIICTPPLRVLLHLVDQPVNLPGTYPYSPTACLGTVGRPTSELTWYVSLLPHHMSWYSW